MFVSNRILIPSSRCKVEPINDFYGGSVEIQVVASDVVFFSFISLHASIYKYLIEIIAKASVTNTVTNCHDRLTNDFQTIS